MDPSVSDTPNFADIFEFTLDRNTASKDLILSEDDKKVESVESDQKYPFSPDRFTHSRQVLSRNALPRKSYWEFEWSGNYVGVGVAFKSMDKNQWLGNSPKAWILECFQYSVRHNGQTTKIFLDDCRKVGVYLDREASTLSFYRVSSDTHTLIHKITHKFSAEPLYAAIYLDDKGSVSLVQITHVSWRFTEC